VSACLTPLSDEVIKQVVAGHLYAHVVLMQLVGRIGTGTGGTIATHPEASSLGDVLTAGEIVPLPFCHQARKQGALVIAEGGEVETVHQPTQSKAIEIGVKLDHVGAGGGHGVHPL